jgi:hypothetical protein
MIDKYIVPGLPIDIVEPKRVSVALWMFEGDTNYFAECSNCEETWLSKPTNYCPNCGCYMINKEKAVERYRNILDDLNRKARKEENANG